MTSDPICPECLQQNSRVADTRRGIAGSVKRIRVCVCGARFRTYEQAVQLRRFKMLLVALFRPIEK